MKWNEEEMKEMKKQRGIRRKARRKSNEKKKTLSIDFGSLVTKSKT